VISLSEFISNLSNIVRPNRFKCVVIPPKNMTTELESDVLQFYIHGGVIPDRSFGEIELKYLGMSLKLPGNEQLQDLTITVLLDSEWELRDYFEVWCDHINSRSDNLKGKMKDLFSEAYIDIIPLGFEGEELTTYRFFNIFPKLVSEIELNMDSTDSAATFQVTFGYSHWLQMEDDTL